MTEYDQKENIAEAKRQALASDLAELKDRLSSNSLVSSVANFFGMDTHSFRRATRASDDLLPYAMIGAGAAMIAGRLWERRREPQAPEDDYLLAEDIGSAHRRLRQRQNESDDAYARRTYDEYGRRLEIERMDGEDDDSFMDRVDAAMQSLSERMGHRYGQASQSLSDAGARVKDTARSVRHNVSGAASATKDGLKSAASSVKEAAKGATSSMSSVASGTRRSVSERAQALRDHVASLSQHAAEQARRLKEQGKVKITQIKQAHEENPAVGVGLGVGLGLILGSLLPTTEREKKATEPLADALMSAANTALSNMNERIEQAESEVQDRVTH
ncbi:hypothetical protein [Parvularcula lutaonensis]|uniref:DUF3618 domain-containing protein n=1 Tax=Parvularcula lutaonensis TaxID=491923 RepID=A0ABV7MDS6_9PROT|nr:hypothetical protein [Parvularcula lutaonensis]GGY52105.1 hypothetical protein GCM10007148_21450 [Parvularcula lutaonensis]